MHLVRTVFRHFYGFPSNICKERDNKRSASAPALVRTTGMSAKGKIFVLFRRFNLEIKNQISAYLVQHAKAKKRQCFFGLSRFLFIVNWKMIMDEWKV